MKKIIFATVFLMGALVLSGCQKSESTKTEEAYSSITEATKKQTDDLSEYKGEKAIIFYKRNCRDCQENKEKAITLANKLRNKGEMVVAVEVPNSKGAKDYPQEITEHFSIPKVDTPALVEYPAESETKNGKALFVPKAAWSIARDSEKQILGE